MDMSDRERLRDYVRQRLHRKKDVGPFSDSESLFASGRLDSLDAMDIVAFLEGEYAIDFAKIEFDMTLLDSVESILAVIAAWKLEHP